MKILKRIGVAACAAGLFLSACSDPRAESDSPAALESTDSAATDPADSKDSGADDGGSDPSGAVAGSDEAGSSVAGGSESDGTDAAAGSAGAAGSTDPSDASDPACLIGAWVVNEADLQRFYDSMDTPAEFTVEGNTGLSFTADSYEYTPGFTLTIDMGGMDATGTMTGSIAGSYTTDAGVITTSNDENNIDLTVTVSGRTIDASALGEGFLGASPVNSANFACTADGPIITWQGGTDGIDILLTRAG